MRAPPADVSFREGTNADLEVTFALSERAIYDAAVKRGVLPAGRQPTEGQVRTSWRRHRKLIEFLAAKQDSRYLICERAGEPLGYARVVRFGVMEELTELMVEPDWQGQGIGRALLEIVWPSDPTPDLGRVVVATGEPTDIGLYMGFGVMPVAGHWHLRLRTSDYLKRRSLEIERVETAVHVLKADRAVEEWMRLEPPVLGHERRDLHDFFCRDRTCLATIDEQTHRATSLAWVSGEGEIGPAVRPGARAARAARARGARPRGGLGRARVPQPLLDDDQLVAPAAAARARIRDLVAELGDVLGAPARARPLCANAPTARPLSELPLTHA